MLTDVVDLDDPFVAVVDLAPSGLLYMVSVRWPREMYQDAILQTTMFSFLMHLITLDTNAT